MLQPLFCCDCWNVYCQKFELCCRELNTVCCLMLAKNCATQVSNPLKLCFNFKFQLREPIKKKCIQSKEIYCSIDYINLLPIIKLLTIYQRSFHKPYFTLFALPIAHSISDFTILHILTLWTGFMPVVRKTKELEMSLIRPTFFLLFWQFRKQHCLSLAKSSEYVQ